MRISNQRLQKADTYRHSLTLLGKLFKFFPVTWQRLICLFSLSHELQVWQTSDRHGHIYWHAYDRLTGRSACACSANEMRIWIEQHYYN